MLASKRVAIMQPYFLPYLGYWQLMESVDEFVIYDDIQFTKRGWIHRNRYLNNNKDKIFTLPLKKDSDYLYIHERELSCCWENERQKLFRKLISAYEKAPYFFEGKMVLEHCLSHPSTNLFEFIFNSINIVKQYLDIDTKILISSEIGDTTMFRGQERVIEICKRLHAKQYINPIGGLELYDRDVFQNENIQLFFHRIENIAYPQLDAEFIPNLSIIDVLMFNGINKTKLLFSKCKIS